MSYLIGRNLSYEIIDSFKDCGEAHFNSKRINERGHSILYECQTCGKTFKSPKKRIRKNMSYAY